MEETRTRWGFLRKDNPEDGYDSCMGITFIAKAMQLIPDDVQLKFIMVAPAAKDVTKQLESGELAMLYSLTFWFL